jgi:hypothetical protein
VAPAPAAQKKGAAAPKGGKAAASAEKNPLFVARPRSQRVGGDIRVSSLSLA